MPAVMYKLFGGLLAVTLVGWLIGQALKSRAPTDRAVYAAGLSWAVCSLATMLFVYATTGALRGDLSMVFLPGAILAAFYLRQHYAKRAHGTPES
jgi:hypothetical protein